MKSQSKLYDPDTERQLVGAALLDPALFAGSVNPADLYLEDLRKIWETGRGLWQQGITPDQVTLADALERRGADIRRSFIASLAAESLSTSYAASWAATVRAYARRRRLFAVLQDGLIAAQNGADLDATIDGVLDGLDRLLNEEAGQPRAEAARLTKSHWSAAELLDAAFPVPKCAVDELLPVGLALLSGEAMIGKSWLALQLAAAVATGGTAAGRQADAGRVLYLAPDDGPRHLQARAAKHGIPRDAEISFATEWPAPVDEALADLERVIGEGEYRLVVLDTLSAVLADRGALPACAARIRRAALDAGAAVLAVGRPRVQQDILEHVSCDAVLTLERGAGRTAGVLRVIGRDIAPQELPLAWQADACTWRLADGDVPAQPDARRNGQHQTTLLGSAPSGNRGAGRHS